ncbi:hypothetical protein BIV59_07800 [Bacillus sp. MUM 13]|nr:hypothetical protein BIV59_07800 [Bacillus sp. MUM 13]
MFKTHKMPPFLYNICSPVIIYYAAGILPFFDKHTIIYGGKPASSFYWDIYKSPLLIYMSSGLKRPFYIPSRERI